MFANLLTNAAKYTNTGGDDPVDRADARRGHAAVSVRDNGIGIPAAQLAAVFDMFMQVDRSDRRAQGGLGIGLTLVRSAGGDARRPGRSAQRRARARAASSWSTLPALEDALAEPQAHDRAARDARAAGDDRRRQPRRRRDARRAAGSAGGDRQVVYSGRAALDMLDEFDPDAVLLDIGMPGMDGYEVARRLRAQPDRADTLLIALTGWGQDQDQENAKAAGFNHHLVKPPDIDRLRELAGRESLTGASLYFPAGTLRSSGDSAGPASTAPVAAKREPWHGQSQVLSAVFQSTGSPCGCRSATAA